MGKTSSELQNYYLNIYKYLKNRAKSYEGEVSKELKNFQKNQFQLSEREFQLSNFNELKKSINSSRVIYLGDFHTFDQNSKNLERLMKILLKTKREIILGIELVHQEHQIYIDEYLKNNITEKEFLELIQYHESWRFPWPQYKIFFDMAKINNFSIVALNSHGTLAERDKKAAKLISHFISNNESLKMLILFGELHIAPNKMPNEVSKLCRKEVNQTIVHQNLDQVFWQLQKSPETQKITSQVVKFNDYEYSLQTAPPWIKYESMIYWYDHLSEDPEFDMHEYVMQTGLKQLGEDTDDNFLFFVKELNELFDTQISDKDLEDFSLYDYTNLKQVVRKIDSEKKTNVKNFYRKLLTVGEIFKLPSKNDYYCSSYSINRLTFLAGSHIHEVALRKHDIQTRDIIYGNNQQLKFLFMFHKSLISYLGSKIFNPFRKCNMYLNIKEQNKNSSSPQKEVALSLINDHTTGIFETNEHLKGLSFIDLFHIARTLGKIIGENIYDHFYQDSIQMKKLFPYIFNKNMELDDYRKLFETISEKVNLKEQKKRFF